MKEEATEEGLVVDLADGRTITVPVAWYPRLSHGTLTERANWRIFGRTSTKMSVLKACSPAANQARLRNLSGVTSNGGPSSK